MKELTFKEKHGIKQEVSKNGEWYAGFYDVITFEPSCVYYAFKAFGELYALENEVECTCPDEGMYAIAAKNGERKSVIISNLQKDAKVELNLTDDFTVYLLDKDNFITKTDLNPNEFILRENTVAVVKNF